MCPVAAANIVEIPPPAVLAIQLALDIVTIPPGSKEQSNFVANFVNDVSRSVGVPSSRINVTSITVSSPTQSPMPRHSPCAMLELARAV
eukprot:3040290-Rhodomonas_salina.1